MYSSKWTLVYFCFHHHHHHIIIIYLKVSCNTLLLLQPPDSSSSLNTSMPRLCCVSFKSVNLEVQAGAEAMMLKLRHSYSLLILFCTCITAHILQVVWRCLHSMLNFWSLFNCFFKFIQLQHAPSFTLQFQHLCLLSQLLIRSASMSLSKMMNRGKFENCNVAICMLYAYFKKFKQTCFYLLQLQLMEIIKTSKGK